jgi:FdhE protein
LIEIGDFGLKQRKINKSLVNREAKKYVDDNPRLKGVIGLYREIFSVQRKLSRDIPDQLPHIEGPQIEFRVTENQLLIGADELKVDLDALKKIMRSLGEALEKKGEGQIEGMERFLGEELEDDEKLRSLVDAFLEHDDEGLDRLIESYALDPAILYMLLHLSLAPFYWKMAGALVRKADLDQVPRGDCPVCGSLPIMGLLRPEEGLRVLECSLCGTRWGFPRIMCPFCSNLDQDKLKYIFAGNDDSRRVYLCDKCEKYIKVSTPPSEKDEEFVLALEDLATAHLDLAAEEKGYERGCKTVFS